LLLEGNATVLPSHEGTFSGFAYDFEAKVAELLAIFRFLRFFVVGLTG
jgi:hypothetical protein